MRKCPYCAESIHERITICPYCDSELDEAPAPRRRSSGGRRKKKSNTGLIIALVIGGVFMLGCACVFVGCFWKGKGAIEAAREMARRSSCKNNLKQIGLALHNYHEIHQHLPPAYVADANGKPLYSWRVELLPHLGEQALYDRFDKTKAWDAPENKYVLEHMPAVYGCPSDENSGGSNTSYAAVTGKDCLFYKDTTRTFEDITDGKSKTIAIGELKEANIPWTKPMDVDGMKHLRINEDQNGFGSHHEDGANFLIADGSVRFIEDDTSAEKMKRWFRFQSNGLPKKRFGQLKKPVEQREFDRRAQAELDRKRKLEKERSVEGFRKAKELSDRVFKERQQVAKKQQEERMKQMKESQKRMDDIRKSTEESHKKRQRLIKQIFDKERQKQKELRERREEMFPKRGR